MLHVATTVRSLIKTARARWHGFSLSQKFLVASFLSTMAAMTLVGTWLADKIESAVNQNAALDAALYVESVVGERIQGLALRPEFDPAVQEALEKLVLKTPLGRRVLSFKVWAEGGRVIYASTSEHVGKIFAPTANLKKAWNGIVQFELDKLNDDEDVVERGFNLPLLEIYVPVRGRYGGAVIAVVEFYEDASALSDDVAAAKRQAWLLLAATGSLVVAALYGMARNASTTIASQQSALNHRIVELSQALAQNRELSQHIEMASRRTAQLNERYLRRVGSDLHDGPAQLVSLALFRLDALRPEPTPNGPGSAPSFRLPDADKAKIRQALATALSEIREVSTGLSLPELDRLSIWETVSEAVKSHEHRSDSRVRTLIERVSPKADRDVKVTAYRFVQEALNNCRRHAPNAAVTVTLKSEPAGRIAIEVRDDGPGFDGNATPRGDRIGLSGMRERLECLGGTLEIHTSPGAGCRLIARVPTITDT